MKRLFAILTGIIALSSCGSSDRNAYLKVYNWGDYIDEDLIPEFEQWYREQTGESVEIIYQTFDINETMLSKIEKGHEDYDVVCPSDYIIERMLRNGLILPIGRDLGSVPNYMDSNIAPFIKTLLSKIDGSGKDANEYVVPYMWGTTGFLYNEKYVSAEDVRTWNVLKDDRFRGRIFVKDAPRDVFSPILIYLRQDDLKSGRTTLDELMYDSSDESIAQVEEYLSDMRYRVAGWEADFGKELMTQEKGWLNFTWSGDAVWAMDGCEELGVPLRYAVPEEGSNIWFDGWVIPKYAQNIKAARYFLNFMCRPDVAIRNMDVIGYVSAIGSPEVLEEMSSQEDFPETVDVTYFFGPEAVAEHLDPAQYPDISVVSRCTLMHDWGDETPKLIEMWSRIKGNQLTTWTLIVIFATIAGIIYYLTRKSVRKSRRHSNKRKKRK